MNIHHVTGHTYYTDITGTSTGIYYLSDGEIVMIDSGGAFSSALFGWLRREKLTVKAVIHTHIHEDHVANSDELAEKYGTVLYARREELAGKDEFMSGRLVSNGESLKLSGQVFRTVLVPGHTDGHQMVITPDDVCFIGDTVLTDEILNMTKLPYQLDSIAYMNSLEILRETKAGRYVAAHMGEITEEDIPHLIESNLKKVNDIYDGILTYTVPGTSVKQAAYAYLKGIGIRDRTIEHHFWLPEMIKDRIYELAVMKKIKIKNARIL